MGRALRTNGRWMTAEKSVTCRWGRARLKWEDSLRGDTERADMHNYGIRGVRALKEVTWEAVGAEKRHGRKVQRK